MIDILEVVDASKHDVFHVHYLGFLVANSPAGKMYIAFLVEHCMIDIQLPVQKSRVPGIRPRSY
jgi:hypothetical protein